MTTATERAIADRARAFDSSGIRKMFELAARLNDPINLSIGEPDFDVPNEVKEALIQAIREGKNRYTPPQGISPLREALQRRVDEQFGHDDRKIIVTSGTSGGLHLLMQTLLNPGDEAIVCDPYFVAYDNLVKLAGGVTRVVSTYPDFQPDPDQVAAAINPRTKLIIANTPGNPTGVCWEEERLRDIAQLAERQGLWLISDEIYSDFSYDRPHRAAADFSPSAIVVSGFSKSHAMTGLRLGYVHGPAEVIDALTQLQQFTFVCAPQPCQWAGLVALQSDVSSRVAEYRRKRDLLVEGLRGHYELAAPGGAIFAFPKLPWGTGDAFFERAIQHNLLIIPGRVFSRRDTHFRISFAAPDDKLQRGIEILRRIAAQGERDHST
jgi:aspartate aminotransferase/aminotransferase